MKPWEALMGKRLSDAGRHLDRGLGRLPPGDDLPQPSEDGFPTVTELVYQLYSPSPPKPVRTPPA